MGGGRRRDESLSISLSAFDKFSRYWARVRSRAGTTESRITYATARSRNRARGKKGGGGERQDPKSNVRNTRRGPGARGSRGASVTATVNGRSRVEERGERGRGRRKRATEIFGTFVWRTIRGYRKKKPGRDIARTPVARSFRSRSSLAACEITEESYAHFTSQRKGTRRVADNSVSEPRSPLSPPFLSSSPPLPPPPSSLSACCSLVATLVFPPTSVTLARGADIKSNLAQWYALRYIGYFADRCLLFLHGLLPRINQAPRLFSALEISRREREISAVQRFPSIRY